MARTALHRAVDTQLWIRGDVRYTKEEEAELRQKHLDECRARVQQVLDDKVVDVNTPDEHLSTPLHTAIVLGGDPDVVRQLIEAGADVNAKDGRGQTPLFLAIVFQHNELAALLVDQGADTQAKTPKGESMLTAACNHTMWPLVKLLLQKGAHIEDVLAPLTRALRISCKEYNDDTVEEIRDFIVDEIRAMRDSSV